MDLFSRDFYFDILDLMMELKLEEPFVLDLPEEPGPEEFIRTHAMTCLKMVGSEPCLGPAG